MDKAFKWIGIVATVLLLFWLAGQIGLVPFGMVVGLAWGVAGFFAAIFKIILFLVFAAALIAGLFMILSWLVRELSS